MVQVTALVALMKAHMRKWLPDILQLIADFWSPTSPLLPHLLRLLSELAGAPPFSGYLSEHQDVLSSIVFFRCSPSIYQYSLVLGAGHFPAH